MTIDDLDRRLLGELAKGGRTSHVSLGEAIGLSGTAVARRQKALEDSGTITGYQAEIALDRLGFVLTVVVMITLNSQNAGALDSFEAAVAASPSVVRCYLMSGSNDYLVIVMARSLEDFESIHRNELARFPHVARLESAFALREVVNRPIPARAFERGRSAADADRSKKR
jgi:DNA-binding Lrp family transcriptional regulator